MNEYQTAAQLYIGHLRALEQRSQAFLIVQSLLITSYAILFVSHMSKGNIPIIMFYGVALLGISFCFFLYISGRTTSQDVWLWKRRMVALEHNGKNPKNKLWTLLILDSRRFRLQKHCADRLPAPTLWLIFPALFFAAWVCALLALYSVSICWYVVTAVVIIGIALIIDCFCNSYSLQEPEPQENYHVPDE